MLIDPLTGMVRYIGKANCVAKRLHAHIIDNRRSHKCSWIKGLLKKGVRPEIEIIDVVKKNEWQFWEKHYISLFRSFGYDLTNRSDGGEGTEHSLETRLRMSAAKIGKPGPWKGKKRPESIEVMRKNNLGKKQSAEFIEKRIKAIRRPVIQFDSNMAQIKEWTSAVEAKNNGFSNVFSNLKGRTESCNGYIFKYK